LFDAFTELKPRAEISYCCELRRATSRLGARRSASGSVTAPERRMSSLRMTYGGGRLAQRLGAAGDGRHLNVGEVLDRELAQILERLRRGHGARRAEPANEDESRAQAAPDGRAEEVSGYGLQQPPTLAVGSAPST
jgi:hypothetical protein